MDHEEAARIQAATRYIAGDLGGAEAEAFEEHFFTCAECGDELKTGAMFAENVRAVFHEDCHSVAPPSTTARSRTGPGWLERFRLSLAVPLAAAACFVFAILVYQNAIQIPGLRSEIAALSAPQSLSWVPLKLARGDTPVSIPKHEKFWMPYFNLPNPGAFPAYICDIETNGGRKIDTAVFAAPVPGQPSSFLLRRSKFTGGTYVFKVRGQNSDQVIATYKLNVNAE